MSPPEVAAGPPGQESAEGEVVISNPQGLHLRPATEFARMALASGCRVRVAVGGTEVSGTSVLELAMLGIAGGTRVRIVAEGENCKETLRRLVELVREPG
jgi:phosphocarrier protein HPr